MREKNQLLVDVALKQITKQNDQSKELHAKAIKASEGCVKQQIDLAEKRLEENRKTLDKAKANTNTNTNTSELEADRAKRTSHLPTPKPKGSV